MRRPSSCAPRAVQVGGPDDYRPVGERKDVLVYTTPPLEQDMELTGPLSVKLFAASSAPDTDWNAMLMDVYPDGYALRLNDGVVRASFRESFEKPSPIEPGKIYEYTIDCWATSMLIRKGHCLRVHIASAAFPKFDRNLNTGHPFGMDSAMRAARQTVFHGARQASLAHRLAGHSAEGEGNSPSLNRRCSPLKAPVQLSHGRPVSEPEQPFLRADVLIGVEIYCSARRRDKC